MNEWISVKDRLPEVGRRVLFVCNELNKVLMGHHIREGLMQFSPIMIDMTHWMPLLEKPE